MNLYSINFGHFGPKDSKYGIAGYVIAENDEAVLDWFLSPERRVLNEEPVSVWWDEKIKYGDTSRERLLQFNGQLDDEEYLDSLSDFHYGHTVYGWSFVKELLNIDIAVLENLGIAIKV